MACASSSWMKLLVLLTLVVGGMSQGKTKDDCVKPAANDTCGGCLAIKDDFRQQLCAFCRENGTQDSDAGSCVWIAEAGFECGEVIIVNDASQCLIISEAYLRNAVIAGVVIGVLLVCGASCYYNRKQQIQQAYEEAEELKRKDREKERRKRYEEARNGTAKARAKSIISPAQMQAESMEAQMQIGIETVQEDEAPKPAVATADKADVDKEEQKGKGNEKKKRKRKHRKQEATESRTGSTELTEVVVHRKKKDSVGDANPATDTAEVSVVAPAPPELESVVFGKTKFKVLSKGGLKVRKKPTRKAERLDALMEGTVIVCFDVEGIWIKHATGWSMVQSPDGAKKFMELVLPKAARRKTIEVDSSDDDMDG